MSLQAQQPQNDQSRGSGKSKSKQKNPDQMNSLIFYLFTRYVRKTAFLTFQEIHEVQEQIQQIEAQYGDMHDFTNYVKCLILRMQGKIQESLDLLKKCHILDVSNVEILKQISKTL